MALADIVVVLGSAIFAVSLGILFIQRIGPAAEAKVAPPEHGLFYLFDGVDLQHATPEAETALQRGPDKTDWQALRTSLQARFPGFPDHGELGEINELRLHAARADDPGILSLHREADMTRVEVEDTARRFLFGVGWKERLGETVQRRSLPCGIERALLLANVGNALGQIVEILLVGRNRIACRLVVRLRESLGFPGAIA